MKLLTIAALTFTILATMFAATVTSGSVATQLARAEGYAQPDQPMLDIAMAQLGSSVPVR